MNTINKNSNPNVVAQKLINPCTNSNNLVDCQSPVNSSPRHNGNTKNTPLASNLKINDRQDAILHSLSRTEENQFSGSSGVGDSYHARNRLKKECANHQRYSNSGGCHGKDDKSKPDGQGSNELPTRPQVDDSELEADEKLYTYRVDDGSEWHPIFPGGGITLRDSGLQKGEKCGQSLRVHDSGYGWYSLSGNSKKNNRMTTLVGCVMHVVIPRHVVRNQLTGQESFMEHSDYIVSSELFDKCKKNYRNKQMSADILRGVTSLCSFYCEHTGICDATRDAFVAVCGRNDSNSVSQRYDNVIGRLNSTYLKLDRDCKHDGVYTSGTVTDIGTQYVNVPYNVSPYQKSELTRPDVRVLNVHGFDNPEIYAGTTGFLPLQECEKDSNSDLGHTTVMFTYNQKPYIHAFTTSNFNTAAASRTFGSCPRNDELRENSNLIAKNLLLKITHSKRVKKFTTTYKDAVQKAYVTVSSGRFDDQGRLKVPNRLVWPGGKDLAPERVLSDNPVLKAEIIDFVAERLRKFAGTTGRSNTMHFLDSVRTGTMRKLKACETLYQEVAVNVLSTFNYRDLRAREVDLVHIKRAQRKWFHSGFLLEEGAQTFVKFGKIGFKKDENAKPSGDGNVKPGRTIGAFVEGAIISSSIPGIVKTLSGTTYNYRIGDLSVEHYVLVTSDKKSISDFLEACVSCKFKPNHLVLMNSSDDMAYALNRDGVMHFGNADISKNDIFTDSLAFFTTFCQEANINVDTANAHLNLAMLPMVMSRSDNQQRVVYDFGAPVEHSGLPTTTILNNCNSQAICAAFAFLLSRDKRRHPSLIMQDAGVCVGHTVTVDVCHNEYGLQILKNSLFYDSQDVAKCYTNLGAYLRNFGSVCGDLDHIKCSKSASEFSVMSLDERADHFCGGVVNGLRNESDNRVLRALRKRFCPIGSSESFEVVKDSYVPITDRDVTDFSMFDASEAVTIRYGLTEEDYLGFEYMVANTRVGQYWKSSLINKVIFKDYGYSDPDFPPIGEEE